MNLTTKCMPILKFVNSHQVSPFIPKGNSMKIHHLTTKPKNSIHKILQNKT